MKTNRSYNPAERDKRHAFPCRAEIQRYFTVWSWQEGPITRDKGAKNNRCFWERLHSDAPQNAQPYCCLVNTVIFYKEQNDHTELCREDTYGFSGASPTILSDPSAKDGEPIFYEVAGGKVLWKEGYWWMRWSAWSNTRIARMLNHGWPHQ